MDNIKMPAAPILDGNSFVVDGDVISATGSGGFPPDTNKGLDVEDNKLVAKVDDETIKFDSDGSIISTNLRFVEHYEESSNMVLNTINKIASESTSFAISGVVADFADDVIVYNKHVSDNGMYSRYTKNNSQYNIYTRASSGTRLFVTTNIVDNVHVATMHDFVVYNESENIHTYTRAMYYYNGSSFTQKSKTSYNITLPTSGSTKFFPVSLSINDGVMLIWCGGSATMPHSTWNNNGYMFSLDNGDNWHYHTISRRQKIFNTKNHNVTQLNNKIYISGFDGSNVVHVYDPLAATKTIEKTIPLTGRVGLFSIGNRVYAFQDETSSNTLYYTTDGDTWTPIEMPLTLTITAAWRNGDVVNFATSNGAIYEYTIDNHLNVISGADSNRVINDVYVDPYNHIAYGFNGYTYNASERNLYKSGPTTWYTVEQDGEDITNQLTKTLRLYL